MVLDLPFPAKALWPNGRAHWATKAAAVKKHRAWAAAAVRAGGAFAPVDPFEWSVVIHPKTRNQIDRDNALASLKSYADGIAQALGVDDKTFATPALTFGEPVKGGRVVITLGSALEARAE